MLSFCLIPSPPFQAYDGCSCCIYMVLVLVMELPCDSVVKNLSAMQETQEIGFDPWFGKLPWRRAWPSTPVLAWRIPWTEEPAGLQSTGFQRVRQDQTEHAQCRLWLILIEFWLLGRGARFEDLFVSITVLCCVTDSVQPVEVKITSENTERLYFSL